jgi:hypothetical protein
MKKAESVFIKLIISIILVVTFFTGLIYIQTTIYTFPPPTPFSGDSLVNPYQNIDNKTYKCNFHAHSIAWKGITNGHNSAQELTKAYKDKGYAVAGISNYHCITDSINSNSPVYIPVYEHGINIFKSHLLGIEPRKPSYFDFPLWQNTSQKQQIINDIRNNGGLVTIAHPKFMDGHTLEDMAQLTNYQFVEVLNHYRISDEYWDAALTAGRLVYAIGNDDTHDINNEPTFRMWTEVYADALTKDGILDAMVKGKSYAVHSFNGECDLKLDSLKTTKYTYGHLNTIYVTGSVKTIECWYSGHVVDTVYNSSKESIAGDKEFLSFQSAIPKDKPYVRYVVKSDKCALYLNPIVRSKNGKTSGVERLVPEIDVLKTWFYRLCVLLIEVVIVFLFLFTWQLKPFKR